jgi:hypothetical protein
MVQGGTYVGVGVVEVDPSAAIVVVDPLGL